MWQYTSQGQINGISGNVDLNYAIYDYLEIIRNANLNHLNDSKNNNDIYYIVKDGDNLSKIASKYNTTWQSIYELNKEQIGNNPNLIHTGLKLRIKE